MIWFLFNTARFRSEQEHIRALEGEAAWLKVSGWRTSTDVHLCLDATITVGADDYPVTLQYPHQYPDVPPAVLPQQSARWSDHQYGDRELCLEYGPDNWVTTLTGADMLKSAFRLLSDQTPRADGQADAVPSRHATTRGQDLRSTYGRLMLTQTTAARLAVATRGQTTVVDFHLLHRKNTSVVVPIAFAALDGVAWADEAVPAALKELADQARGLTFFLPTGVMLPAESKGIAFREKLRELGLILPDNYAPGFFDFVLTWGDDGAHLVRFLNDSDDDVVVRAVVSAEGGVRQDAALDDLRNKSIGLVGCGSAGAKIATMLARAGVGKFTLIDDDLLLPENLVRHDLDWSSIAEHKAEALARRLELVNPHVKTTVRKNRLGGQQANVTLDWDLTLLETCDIIIDATANERVFNLAAAAAKASSKPLVWLKIYAGGIGGLMARSRPALDPEPQVVRAAIDAWCAAQATPVPRAIGRYDGQDENGTPMIATDADVSVIAAHAARFSLDLLLARAPSAFPFSAYLIGLSQGWIFEQPFQTFPIDIGPAPVKEEEVTPDEATVNEILEVLKDRRDLPSVTA
ncbi:MAG: ThiF family adenylyltransferase [Nitrospiraceae bacterium]